MFEGMMKDKVTLVKKDGTVAKENIPASVQPNKIFMTDKTLPLEPGDHLLRTLPSGLVEEYIVDEPGYYSGLTGMDPHFQTKVHRSDAPEAKPSTIINNIQGHNARVNINSTDNSQNIAVDASKHEVLQGLREKLEDSAIPDADRPAIREAIEKMEKTSSKDGFREGYQAFMAAAANHIAVFGPLLGALSGLL